MVDSSAGWVRTAVALGQQGVVRAWVGTVLIGDTVLIGSVAGGGVGGGL